MKVLVTGATGVYGRSVVERLHRRGHEVVAMARNPPKALPAGVRFAQGDVADAGPVRDAMEDCEVVAHLAFVVTPLKSEEESRRINLGGTQNVLDAMRETGARRLVFASSAMSYGANPDNPPLFTEEHEQRPAPDYVYGTHKKEAERLISESGVEAVMARTAVTVGRNIDNLLVDIFGAPAIAGIKGVDIRYQLIHQDDVGRFLALACEEGPPGPVNVAPPDFLPLPEIAQILGKRYVEVSESQVLKAVEFMWEHDLADITPGEASGISYLPRLAVDRLRDEWGFECAWTTAEAVLDLRRALAGITVVAKRRIELPWRLRYPQQRPGEVVTGDGATGRPASPAIPGELDTPVRLAHPTYRAATAAGPPLAALTLDVHAHLLRAAATGALDAFGMPEDQRIQLGGVGAGIFGHRLYVNDDVAAFAAQASRVRRRTLALGYAKEVDALVAGSASVFARAEGLADQTDERLDATLGVVCDELSWLWAAISVGALLDGERLDGWDTLVTVLPSGAPPAGTAAAGPALVGRHAAPRALAERTALALSRTLAAAVRERAARLESAGVLAEMEDVGHLTWDELLQPPADATELIERRRAEHARLSELEVPATVSAVGPGSAVQTTAIPTEELVTS